jgi:hypothetical protein
MSDNIETCNECGLVYYTSLIPHQCAKWIRLPTHLRDSLDARLPKEQATMSINDHDDTAEEEANEREIRRIRQARTAVSTRCWAGNHHGCGIHGIPCDCECHQTTPTQPAPDAGGEWRVRLLPGRAQVIAGDLIILDNIDPQTAAQIVSDHNAVPKLVAAAEAALRYDERIRQHAWKGKSYAEDDTLDDLYDDWIKKSRAALAATADRGGE